MKARSEGVDEAPRSVKGARAARGSGGLALCIVGNA